MKVLISAYACEPNKGSEPGVGWNMAREMAKYHDIWIITRANNRSAIEAELSCEHISNLTFVYYDLPRWTMWWKLGERGVQVYYYLWQIGIYLVAKRLHRKINFDLLHHVTFVKYWSPSFISLLPLPFIWGPVGGGESAPKAFCLDFSLRGKMYEIVRIIARWLGMHDPFVRLTAKRSSKALVSTKETALQVRSLKTQDVEIFGQTGLSQADIKRLSNFPIFNIKTIRLISIGRLLHWKGFHLGLRAFAHANLPNAEYWIVGDGPERQHLETLVKKLNIAKYVQFWGKLSRKNTLEKLAKSSVLVHPSLHDSGGWVCLEAMALGKPVICLDLGGPATQVTNREGFKILASNPDQAVYDIAEAMKRLVSDKELMFQMGRAGQMRVRQHFTWDKKVQSLNNFYLDVVYGKGHAESIKQ
ncbi:MAG: glycosyltransferase family 4 protein [Deltaproteobacteria bacterium]|nr:glycosyltransferase family 4 protein [Deltaproteobacteria bacterium]